MLFLQKHDSVYRDPLIGFQSGLWFVFAVSALHGPPSLTPQPNTQPLPTVWEAGV